MIKTIAAVPQEYTHSFSAIINDLDFDIVARNVIILLVALALNDVARTVDCMLHIWYSAFIKQDHLDILTSTIRPLVEEIVGKIANKSAGAIFGKTWTYGSRSLRVVSSKEQWSMLLSYLETPQGLSLKQAQEARLEITLAKERQDNKDRRMFAQPPAHRVCGERFREEGILLPFGQSRKDFILPNPFVPSANTTVWLLML